MCLLVTIHHGKIHQITGPTCCCLLYDECVEEPSSLLQEQKSSLSRLVRHRLTDSQPRVRTITHASIRVSTASRSLKREKLEHAIRVHQQSNMLDEKDEKIHCIVNMQNEKIHCIVKTYAAVSNRVCSFVWTLRWETESILGISCSCSCSALRRLNVGLRLFFIHRPHMTVSSTDIPDRESLLEMTGLLCWTMRDCHEHYSLFIYLSLVSVVAVNLESVLGRQGVCREYRLDGTQVRLHSCQV